jgi:hypothetical protein
MDVSSLPQALVWLRPGKSTWYQLNRGEMGPHSHFWRFAEEKQSLIPDEIRTSDLMNVEQQCSDYVVLLHMYTYPTTQASFKIILNSVFKIRLQNLAN